MAASDALVGVHSANENQQETGTSLAVTTLMARDAAKDGIPPAIIGKMVETTPGRVEWLTHADLSSMNVAVYDGDTPTATRQTVTASVPQVAPTPSPLPPPAAPPAQASVPPGFAAGRDDRRAWDVWLSGLRGPYRDGAACRGRALATARTASIAATSPWVARSRANAWRRWPPGSPSMPTTPPDGTARASPSPRVGRPRPNTRARISAARMWRI
jgi:hypothetical protein